MIECSQKVQSVCPYGETCGGGEYKEGSDCDKFAESLQNKKAHKPGGGPITREQVEKMRGEWKHKFTTDDSVFCTSCKTTFRAYYDEHNFCPACGAPMTYNAVDILWKRLEEMQDAAD